MGGVTCPVAPAARVLIADDRARSRRGLRALLDTQPEIEVIGHARNGKEALAMVETLRPDTVLMDARMPTMDGLSATRAIKDRWPDVRVIVLTMYGSLRRAAISSGADEFLIKGCLAQEILRAISKEAEDHDRT